MIDTDVFFADIFRVISVIMLVIAGFKPGDACYGKELIVVQEKGLTNIGAQSGVQGEQFFAGNGVVDVAAVLALFGVWHAGADAGFLDRGDQLFVLGDAVDFVNAAELAPDFAVKIGYQRRLFLPCDPECVICSIHEDRFCWETAVERIGHFLPDVLRLLGRDFGELGRF